MTLYLETTRGFVPWGGEPVGDGEDAVRHQLSIEHQWSAEQLAEIGLFAPAEPLPRPWHMREISRAVARVDGVVRYVRVLDPIPLAELKEIRLAELAERRWEIETGGVTVGQLTVPSDRETQGRIDQIAKAFADGDITGSVLFKLAPGVHIEVDEPTIRAVKAAGAQHIQSCFRREGELAASILAANDRASLEAIDVQGFWI